MVVGSGANSEGFEVAGGNQLPRFTALRYVVPMLCEMLDTPVGPMEFVADSAVAASVKKHFHHDPGVAFFMRRHSLFPFFDIGANVGYFSVLAARMGGPVLAFEPDEENLMLLRKNIASAAVEVTVFPVAVAAEDGMVWLGAMNCGRSVNSQENLAELTARSVRSVVAETGIVPAFAKIDIEGGETDALLGMEGLDSTTLEIEFSWRDHGHRFGNWLRMRPPGRYRWEFLLSPSEGAGELLDLNGRHFFLSTANSRSELDTIIDKLKASTDERPSRKWELCISATR